MDSKTAARASGVRCAHVRCTVSGDFQLARAQLHDTGL